MSKEKPMDKEVTRNCIVATHMILEEIKQTSFANETNVTIGLDDNNELKHNLSFLCCCLIDIADDLLEEQ